MFEFFKRDISESVRVEGPVMVTDCHRFNAMVLWPQGAWAGVGFFPPGFSESWLMTPPFISRYDKRAAHGGGLAHFDPIRKGACDAWKVRWTCNEKDVGQTWVFSFRTLSTKDTCSVERWGQKFDSLLIPIGYQWI